MANTKRLCDCGHGGKDRRRPGVLAAAAVTLLLAISPAVAMGQADEEYLPPPNNPGNPDGPNGGPTATPPPSDGPSSGSTGGGGTGSGGTSSGGVEDVPQSGSSGGESAVAPVAPTDGGGGADGAGGTGGSGDKKPSGGDDKPDPAKKLSVSPLSDSINRPRVALGAQAATDSGVWKIAVLGGIILAVTIAAVLLRRRLSGSRT